MQKIVITQKFHRYVATGEETAERREDFPVGKTLAVPDQVSAEDAASWVAKGLARDASPRPTETAAA